MKPWLCPSHCIRCLLQTVPLNISAVSTAQLPALQMIREMDWDGAKPDYLRRDASSLPAWVVNSKGVSLLPQRTTTLGTTQPITGEQSAAARFMQGSWDGHYKRRPLQGQCHALRDALVGCRAELGSGLGKGLDGPVPTPAGSQYPSGMKAYHRR